MSDETFLVLILLLLVLVSVLSLWASIRLGAYGGTEPLRARADARPARRLADKDDDLIQQINGLT